MSSIELPLYWIFMAVGAYWILRAIRTFISWAKPSLLTVKPFSCDVCMCGWSSIIIYLLACLPTLTFTFTLHESFISAGLLLIGLRFIPASDDEPDIEGL